MFLDWVFSTSPRPLAGRPPLVSCPRLLIQYIRSYPPYWRPFLHPQFEDPTFRGDKDSLITEHKCIIIKVAESNGVRQFSSALRTVPNIVALAQNEVISCWIFDVGLEIWRTISYCVSEDGKNNIKMFPYAFSIHRDTPFTHRADVYTRIHVWIFCKLSPYFLM